MPKKDTLTKAHIVNALMEQNGFTQKKSFETVAAMLEIIKSNLESGDDVMISGFGKFCVRKKHERLGHRRGHAVGAKKGRHIPVFGYIEKETEQKES